MVQPRATTQIAYDGDRRILRFRLLGVVDSGAVIGAFKAAGDLGLETVPLGAVWDMRDADLSELDLNGIRAAWQARSFPPEFSNIARVAIVVAKETEAILLRLWESGLTAGDELVRRTFTDYDQAYAWASQERPADT